jgi:hypothetical protein
MAIFMFYCSFAMLFTLLKLSHKYVTIIILNLSFPFCFISYELTCIFHVVLCFYYPFPMTISLHKLTFISHCFIFPYILPFSRRLSLSVIAFINVSIRKCLFPFTIFQEILKKSLISLSIRADMHTITFNFTIAPLSNIAISFARFPNARPMFMPTAPLPLIFFPISPHKLSLTIS